jgi:hypothetical protein
MADGNGNLFLKDEVRPESPSGGRGPCPALPPGSAALRRMAQRAEEVSKVRRAFAAVGREIGLAEASALAGVVCEHPNHWRDYRDQAPRMFGPKAGLPRINVNVLIAIYAEALDQMESA